MRNRISLVITLAIMSICNMIVINASEIYEPILKDGRKWLVSVQWNEEDDNIERYWFTVDKDTVINDIEAKKIICTNADNQEEKEVSYAADDNGSLYGFWYGIGMYDYEWIEEDVIRIDCEAGTDFRSGGLIMVSGIDYISVGDSRRRRIMLNAPDLPELGNFYWVEGFGASSSRGWLFNWFPIPNCECRKSCFWGVYLATVEGVYDNDELIFTKEDFTQGLGIEYINRDDEAGDDTIYDIFGRRVSSPMKGSVYISNGRKFIAR